MILLLLLLSATLAQEASESIGKDSIGKRRESIYNAAFLSIFWRIALLLATLAFGVEFRFDTASLPTLSVRIVLEIIMAFLGAEMLLKAERSTVGFLRLLTIPLLLAVDLTLGYAISSMQIIGIGIMLFALTLAFHHNPKGKKGAWLAVASALVGVAGASFYKFNITHYNSVVAEQVIVLSAVMVFFYATSGKSPWRLLFKPFTGAQSLSSGIGFTLESFAYSLAPASVVIALKRTFALNWSIVSGHKYFHEKTLGRKVYSGAIMAIGLALIALPSIVN